MPIADVDESGLEGKFKSGLMGFVDTLPLFKDILPGKESYTVSNLHKELTQKDFAAHDAEEDVAALFWFFFAESCLILELLASLWQSNQQP